MKETLRMVLVLFFVCILSAGSLSFLYISTKERIAQNSLLKEVALKKQVLPQAKQFLTKQINSEIIEECYDDNKHLVGLIINSSCYGYGGEIKYILSVSTTMPVRIKSVKIVSHRETPGLGANVTKDKFLLQFVNKTAEEVVLKKDDINGKIDAITGATITSRAVTNSVRKVLQNETLEKFISNLYSAVVPQKQLSPIKKVTEQYKINIATTTEVTQ